MKSLSVAEILSNLDTVLDSAQKERIVITRGGKPSVVLVGIESYDEEDLRLASSPEFWRLIEERRTGSSVPLSELKARLEARERSQAPAKATKNRSGKSPNKPRKSKPGTVSRSKKGQASS
jgi:prevent-host-death family protein